MLATLAVAVVTSTGCDLPQSTGNGGASGNGEQFEMRVTIGPAGDFDGIGSAIAAVVGEADAGRVGIAPVTLELLSNYIMEEQLIVVGNDLGWIRLKGPQGSVPVRGSALTTTLRHREAVYPLFAVLDGGQLPVIDAHFRIDDSGSPEGRVGVFVARGSRAVLLDGAGVDNAGGVGLHVVSGSHVSARGTEWSRARDGIRVADASVADCSHARIHDVAGLGLYVGDGAVVDCSAAHLAGIGGRSAVVALQAATVQLHRVHVTDVQGHAVDARTGSRAHVGDAVLEGGHSVDVRVLRGGFVTLHGTEASLSQAPNDLTDDGLILQ